MFDYGCQFGCTFVVVASCGCHASVFQLFVIIGAARGDRERGAAGGEEVEEAMPELF